MTNSETPTQERPPAQGHPPARRFADMETLSQELAAQIAASLGSAISARGLASLVVSGGRSPVRLFEILRAQPIEWARVCVALADERWVNPEDAASNEHLVRDVLLKEQAAAARFHGLKNGAPTGYALGVGVADAHGHPVLQHGGAVSGFVSLNTVWPDARAAVVVFSNMDGSSAPESISVVMV